MDWILLTPSGACRTSGARRIYSARYCEKKSRTCGDQSNRLRTSTKCWRVGWHRDRMNRACRCGWKKPAGLWLLYRNIGRQPPLQKSAASTPMRSAAPFGSGQGRRRPSSGAGTAWPWLSIYSGDKNSVWRRSPSHSAFTMRFIFPSASRKLMELLPPSSATCLPNQQGRFSVRVASRRGDSRKAGRINVPPRATGVASPRHVGG